jgi:transcriptional regulator with GAF, ATPase, and Fis domain
MIVPATNSSDNPGVLIASSNPSLRRQIIERLPEHWLPVEEALGGADALGKLETSECRMLLLDRHLPDLDANELLGLVHRRYPGVDVRTIDADVGSVVLRPAGGPSETEHDADSEAGGGPLLEGMIGSSEAMCAVSRAVRRVASPETTVFIAGETGTGKELIAQQIHRLSPRRSKPLVIINCAAIPEALLESELFGYVRGAFTGAAQSRLGRIQSANGGTLFLDEIGEMPIALQPKLLRFLESGELQRLGSSETWRADVRVLSATNRNVHQLSDQSLFRPDLYYRLCVFPIVLPPLRQRGSDIAELAEHFLQHFAPEMRLSDAAIERLATYPWPGNVRELRHVIERATILAASREIGTSDLLFDAAIEAGLENSNPA